MQQPSVGRIVHYLSFGTPPKADGMQAFPSEPCAAIVTKVHDMSPVPESGVPYVDLCVLYPNGMSFKTSVRYDDSPAPKGGTWAWPPRV